MFGTEAHSPTTKTVIKLLAVSVTGQHFGIEFQDLDMTPHVRLELQEYEMNLWTWSKGKAK